MTGIPIGEFSKQFDDFVAEVLIPPFLADQFRASQLVRGKHGSAWHEQKRTHRPAIDGLILQLMDADTSEEIEIILRRTDPMLLPFYFERLLTAMDGLKSMIAERRKLPPVGPWAGMIATLLLMAGED